ncbi:MULTISPECIES: hypothetical protein [Paraburkholderia]|uniref:hypothetical protein n=1 Tax=Paraburkholderia TaxID=1822464 RepID=UPI00225880D9|nr:MULTISPECIES: hypothetical protein [Paraburkholderia]MCX4156143.1 hypothetical protein [Paraburkholderia aspalathi]MDN7165549.1 hypothetical protein [Paraburkholderia sp. SECH2]MDQ6394035.1 hypothetical protein [Paraburkholderia aspalathi]
MQIQDKAEFAKALNLCYSTLQKPLPESDALKLWFRLLEPYSLADVKGALIRHMAESKYAPVPADVIGRLNTRIDCWLGASEAWAVAKLAYDEQNTVVTCAEIQQALDHVRHLLDDGDYSAAGAFKETYLRISNVARLSLAVPHWTISVGFDAVQREQVVQRAVDEGRIALDDGRVIYPALVGPDDSDAFDEETAARNHSQIAGVLAVLRKKQEPAPIRDKAPEITEAEQRKAEQQRKVDDRLMLEAKKHAQDEREAAIDARERAVAKREAAIVAWQAAHPDVALEGAA